DQSKLFVESRYNGADENFFKVFQYPFIAGDPSTALRDPNCLVINESTARRFFGNTDAVGKVVDIKAPSGKFVPCTIKGVIRDMPLKSHLQIDIIFSLSSEPNLKKNESTWIWTAFGTYVLVREGADVAAVVEKMQGIPPRRAAETTQSVFNQTFDSF